MIKFTAIIFLFLSMASCVSQVPKSNARLEWSKSPDLSKVVFEGGDGKSIEHPVIIKNAGNSRNGIASEYAYLAKMHGEKFKDWKPIGQATKTSNGKNIDVINIQLIAANETITYYFDITEFYGKF